jgi:DNA-binding MarR family transcriptional regulator
MTSPTEKPFVEKVNTRYLETLVGYNARRAALAVISQFLEEMAVYDLRPVDFSALSLITHNPGITSRQLCTTLGIQAPNIVAMVNGFEKRGLIARHAHPRDGRAFGLMLTADGEALMAKAEKTASNLESSVSEKLTPEERKTMIKLLKKIYK